MEDIRRKREIVTRPVLRKEHFRFIATAVCSDELHWFEADYGEIATPVGNCVIWQLMPYTLRDLGPLSEEERKNLIQKLFK